MAAHAWWSINVLSANNNGSGYINHYEIEFRATIGGADQCAGGTAFGTGVATFGTVPAQAFDNNNDATVYFVANNIPHRVGYQFASPVNVEQIAYYVQDRIFTPDNFTLQFSDDGVSWTTYKTYSNKIFSTWTNNFLNLPTPDAAATQPQVMVIN